MKAHPAAKPVAEAGSRQRISTKKLFAAMAGSTLVIRVQAGRADRLRRDDGVAQQEYQPHGIHFVFPSFSNILPYLRLIRLTSLGAEAGNRLLLDTAQVTGSDGRLQRFTAGTRQHGDHALDSQSRINLRKPDNRFRRLIGK